MPMYVWKNNVTNKEVEVLRDFNDYIVPPSPEELAAADATEDEGEWIRLIGRGIMTQKSDSWGPGKGHW